MKWKKTIQDRKPGNITYFDDKNGTLDDLPENNFRSNKKEGYTNSVNESQNENIKNALKALNEGDLSVRLEPDEDCDRLIANEFNTLVSIFQNLNSEVESVSKSVGLDGDFDKRISLKSDKGIWGNFEGSVNNLITNMAKPTYEIGRVVSAVANGELDSKMDLIIGGKKLKGEYLEIGNIVNTMVDQLNAFSSEVSRVAKEVGTDGILGGQAKVEGVRGTWKVLTNNVNFMAANLTTQVRNIAEVNTAVANGDLTKKITIDARGEILELKDTINVMVDQLNSFSGEVIRVATEVGTEGKLGGQAKVEGVSGTWQVLTNTVNGLAANLTSQVRSIAEVNTAVANGDLSKKITIDASGEVLELKNTINTMVDQLNAFAGEVTRVAKEVGTDGVLGGQAKVEGVGGTWKDLTDNVNFMADSLTGQVRDIAYVIKAVAEGDLTKKITALAKGEILDLKVIINTMVDKLNEFSSEVNRLAKEVGTEGKLGSQAHVKDVEGDWKELTYNVNLMAANLTEQVKDINKVAKTLGLSSENLKGVSEKMVGNSNETTTQAGSVSKTSEDVNKNVDAVATASEQMTSSIKEIAINATNATKVAVQAVDMANKTNKTISKLGESSKEIGNVINIIISIAEQTNLLALNATIEAARAGEAGKGFAVVANEVKELAKETASATEDISKNIETIQTDTKSAVEIIGEISKIINQINDIQNTIATAVEEQTVTTNEIAQNADKAAKGVTGITNNITAVAKASQETTEGAVDTQKAAAEMAQLAAQLDKLVGQFVF